MSRGPLDFSPVALVQRVLLFVTLAGVVSCAQSFPRESVDVSAKVSVNRAVAGTAQFELGDVAPVTVQVQGWDTRQKGLERRADDFEIVLPWFRDRLGGGRAQGTDGSAVTFSGEMYVAPNGWAAKKGDASICRPLAGDSITGMRRI